MALMVTIFVASLVGSLHCAGMCGAFLAIAVGDIGGDGKTTRMRTQFAYHLGRLGTYVVLGIAAGALGRVLDLGGVLAGVGPVAAVLAGGTMVVFGGITLLRLWGVKMAIGTRPGILRAVSDRGYRLAMSLGAVQRATMIGLLTTLLPCGWLYAFVATAAGTASPIKGGLAMAVFWLGTLPMMVSLGAGLRGLLGGIGGGRLGRWVPVATCLMLIGMGLWTVGRRGTMSVGGMLTVASADHVSQEKKTKPKPACCEQEVVSESR